MEIFDAPLLLTGPLSSKERRLQLKKDASFAAKLLTELWQQRDLCTIRPVLRASQALGFLTHHVVGMGVGFGHGSGFVVRRLEGEGRWSAPSYFRLHNIGVIVGHKRLESLLCFKDDNTLERFLGVQIFDRAPQSSSVHGEGGASATERLAADTSRTGYIRRGDSSTLEQLEQAWSRDAQPLLLTYTLEHGSLLEGTFKTGVLRPDEDRDREMLGYDAGPGNVLRGEMHQPVEFVDLYLLLNRLSAWDELRRVGSDASLALESPRQGTLTPTTLPDEPAPDWHGSPYTPSAFGPQQESPGTPAARPRTPTIRMAASTAPTAENMARSPQLHRRITNWGGDSSAERGAAAAPPGGRPGAGDDDEDDEEGGEEEEEELRERLRGGRGGRPRMLRSRSEPALGSFDCGCSCMGINF